MENPPIYKYKSPLKGFEDAPPLSSELNQDGKSFKNEKKETLSKSYAAFTDGVTNGIRGGFDIHVYYDQTDQQQTQYAHDLWKRIRYEFPELRIYKVWDRPIGPHTLAMFEVNVFTPQQFGAFIPWLIINRGPLSALVHPNCEDGDAERDHTQRASWLGSPVPIDVQIFKQM